ncbi:MAG: hypothetical protein ACJ75Z_06290 [Solirubrobacterales bacterium]
MVMRWVAVGATLLLQLLLVTLSALWAAAAAAEPGSGPRETVDQTFTTVRPNTPTGGSFSASFHAAGDPQGTPPFQTRMVVHPPRGMRYDTSVPDRCTAPDIQLEIMGPAACPRGSRLGGGTIEGLVLAPFAHFVLDHYHHRVYVLNNTNEEIVLIESEGFTVVRGHLSPDGTMDFTQPTCFPVPPVGGCLDNYVIQLKNAIAMAPYTKTSGGRLRSYATTPPRCPTRHYWRTTVQFWWSDGSTDTVVTKQACRAGNSG